MFAAADRILRTVVAAGVLATVSVTPAALAAQPGQPAGAAEKKVDAEAKAVLERSAATIKGLASLAYSVELTSEAQGPFANLIPTGSGYIQMIQTKQQGLGGLWLRRIIGEVDAPPGGVQKIDLLRGPKFDSWKEVEDERVITKVFSTRPPASQTNHTFLIINELLLRNPFEDELKAQTITLDGTEEINGEACDVVTVEYGRRGTGGELSKYGSIPSGSTKWFISKSDSLPRRVQRISGGSGISVMLTQTLRDIEQNPRISPEQLEIIVPEGWTEDAYVKADIGLSEDAAVPNQDTPDRVRQARERELARRQQQGRFQDAPSFELSDLDGNLISSDEIAGKVTVMYFWGTWSQQSTAFHPMVDALAEEFEDDGVTVFAPVVNERSKDAVAKVVNDGGYRFVPLFGEGGRGVGADKAARDFRVRLFPSFVVIDAEGRIRLSEATTRETKPDELIGKVRDAVQAAVNDAGEN
ncbi:MAG: TlpA disulfide reductase family protein [Planctomycetota bacterium]